MATPEELAASYAAAWTERDATRRTALLESCCSPDVRFLQEGAEDVRPSSPSSTKLFGDPGPPPGGPG